MEFILWTCVGILLCYLAMTGWTRLQAGRKILAGPPKPSPDEQKKKAEKDKAEKLKGKRLRSDGLAYLFVFVLLLGVVLFLLINSIAS